MGDEAFKNKKNEPIHVSLHCSIRLCAVLRTWHQMTLHARPLWLSTWIQVRQARWTQTSVWVVMDSAMASKRPTTRQSPLKSHTEKKRKVLSAACPESKRNYVQSQAGTWTNIGYAFNSQSQLQLELGLKTHSNQVRKHYRPLLELDH